MTKCNYGIPFAPVAPVSSASAGATGRDSVAPARNSWNVAQSVEQGAVNARVAGSKPAIPAKLMSGRQRLGGMSTLPSTTGAGGTRANSISLPPLPSRSIIPAGAPLEPFNLSETVKDIAALAFTFLFLGSVSVLFAASVFLLFFCDLH